MPYRRFEWHQHLTDVSREYRSARAAIDRFMAAVASTPDLLIAEPKTREYLGLASDNLEGTYLVRLFAAFEAALRSYDRSRHNDPDRTSKASTMIAEIGGKRGHDIHASVRQRAQEVCRLRNYWAHESDEKPASMNIDEARQRLQIYLSGLPDEWD